MKKFFVDENDLILVSGDTSKEEFLNASETEQYNAIETVVNLLVEADFNITIENIHENASLIDIGAVNDPDGIDNVAQAKNEAFVESLLNTIGVPKDSEEGGRFDEFINILETGCDFDCQDVTLQQFLFSLAAEYFDLQENYALIMASKGAAIEEDKIQIASPEELSDFFGPDYDYPAYPRAEYSKLSEEDKQKFNNDYFVWLHDCLMGEAN